MARPSTIISSLKVAAFAGLLSALPAAAQAVEYCHDHHRMPPAAFQREPNVPYTIVTVPPAEMDAQPQSPIFGKVWGHAHDNHDGTWTIFIRGGLAPADRACVIIYEKAHLPPNSWIDGKVEIPSTVSAWRAKGGTVAP